MIRSQSRRRLRGHNQVGCRMHGQRQLGQLFGRPGSSSIGRRRPEFWVEFNPIPVTPLLKIPADVMPLEPTGIERDKMGQVVACQPSYFFFVRRCACLAARIERSSIVSITRGLTSR
jgi:hypothetical protein